MDYSTFTKWVAGFFQEPDGKPSARRLDMVSAHYAVLAVLLLLAGVAAGIAWTHAADKDQLMPVLNAVLALVKWLAGLAVTGSTTNHILGQHLKNRAAAIAAAGQAAGPVAPSGADTNS